MVCEMGARVSVRAGVETNRFAWLSVQTLFVNVAAVCNYQASPNYE